MAAWLPDQEALHGFQENDRTASCPSAYTLCYRQLAMQA